MVIVRMLKRRQSLFDGGTIFTLISTRRLMNARPNYLGILFDDQCFTNNNKKTRYDKCHVTTTIIRTFATDNNKFNSSNKRNEQQQQQNDNWRPMSMSERILQFGTGVKLLWNDWHIYQNIQDASTTPRNAWTVQQEKLQKLSSRYANQIVQTHIPWKQKEQQRRFINGFNTVFPVVTLWLVPIIGYIPMLLSITAPRLFLSRHFHNVYEMFHYNYLSYQQRYTYYDRVHRLFIEKFDNVNVFEKDFIENMTRYTKNNDVAGPILTSNAIQDLYQMFIGTTTTQSIIEKMSREYLIYFSLSVGVYQTLPTSEIALCLARISPSWYLRRRIRSLAITIADDDNSLLLQREVSFGEPTITSIQDVISTLTDIELSDACLIRGLPISSDHQTISVNDNMRIMLINHLEMIASLEAKVEEEIEKRNNETKRPNVNDEEVLGLFTLHLAIIRDYLKKKNTS